MSITVTANIGCGADTCVRTHAVVGPYADNMLMDDTRHVEIRPVIGEL